MSQLLLVEDEKLLRWSLRTRLQNAGYVVDEAATLGEADEQLKRRRPDVVLLDVNLPDGNGLDFLSSQRDKLAESTVLVFTGDGRIEDAVLAMKLVAADFLTKPVDHEDLLRVIARATNLRREKLDAENSQRAREKQAKAKI